MKVAYSQLRQPRIAVLDNRSVLVEATDLTAELKRGLSYIRNQKQLKGTKQLLGKRTS
jgi:hypothetical protein